MTGVFFYPADITTRHDVDSAIKAAWSNHVRREYPNENVAAGCTLVGTDQASAQRHHDYVRGAQKVKVLDVDWKYVPGQDMPPAYDSRITNYYCFAYFGQSNYASSVFPAPWNIDTGILQKDFAQFVKEKYQSGEKVTGSCFTSRPDKAAAEAMKVHHEETNTHQFSATWACVLPVLAATRPRMSLRSFFLMLCSPPASGL